MKSGAIQKPGVLLLPALHGQLVRTIFTILARIRKRGAAILLVEQNARQALRLADRAYVLETGTIVHSGPARELATSPIVTAAYLGQPVVGGASS